MRADKPESVTLQTQPINSQCDMNNSTENINKDLSNTKADINQSVTVTPQKLNRKQRRRLQQQQNAEKNAITSQPTSATPAELPTTQNATTSQAAPTESSHTKLNAGDGILPTPPASYRILLDNQGQQPDSISDNVIGRNPGSQDSGLTPQKPISKPTPIGQEAKQNEAASVKRPIGSSRPSSQQQMPAPIQPPNMHSASQASDLSNKMANTDLQPPTNPVLLAHLHLQKLGLEDSRGPNFSAPPASASSQAVTNSYIQQYLQQMNKASDTTASSSTNGSNIVTPLLSTSSMSLSSLLPRPPEPASSLSDGPQKSKLLQWTQPGSASNSEPTTPPSADEKEKSFSQKVDPVSAKWGVLAAPRLSPTPAEFKPGVPWRPRGVSMSENDDEGCDVLLESAKQIDIPQTNFASKLMQQQQLQQQQHDLDDAAASRALSHAQAQRGVMADNKAPSDYPSWVLLKGIPPMVRLVFLVCILYVRTVWFFRKFVILGKFLAITLTLR